MSAMASSPVWKPVRRVHPTTISHFSAMTLPSWLGRAARNRHRHAIEQASVDGVEDDAMIQHERAVKFDFHRSSPLHNRNIGFIGAGAMASAIIKGLLASGISPGRISASDPGARAREGQGARLERHW